MVRREFIIACSAALGLVACGGAGAQPPSPVSQPSRSDRVLKTEEQWRADLSAEEFRILRQKGTERAFTGKHHDSKTPGVYVCAGCGLPLFSSEHKFDSGTGWPSYFQPLSGDRVDEITDHKLGMVRTEITCARCGGHLGHVFADGPKPTGQRYCINGNVLKKLPLTKESKTPTSPKP